MINGNMVKVAIAMSLLLSGLLGGRALADSRTEKITKVNAAALVIELLLQLPWEKIAKTVEDKLVGIQDKKAPQNAVSAPIVGNIFKLKLATQEIESFSSDSNHTWYGSLTISVKQKSLAHYSFDMQKAQIAVFPNNKLVKITLPKLDVDSIQSLNKDTDRETSFIRIMFHGNTWPHLLKHVENGIEHVTRTEADKQAIIVRAQVVELFKQEAVKQINKAFPGAGVLVVVE